MNDSTSTSAAPRSGFLRQILLVVGGSVALVLITGVLFQMFRPVTGQAQEKAPARSTTGKAAVGGASNQEATRYLARITNGKNVTMVTYDEVAHECMLRHGREVLDNIVNRKVIEAACQEQQISISEAEVDQEIVKIAKKFNMSVEEWYNMLSAERNVTKAQYRRDIIWPMLALKKLAGGDVKITKTELQQAFLRNYGPRVKARIIVQDNQRRAAEAWDFVSQHPDQFDEAVKKYSIDPGSRSLGGAIPPIPQYSGNPLSEPIEQAAFKLKVGECSSVIQSGQQYVIIKCEGRTEQVVSSVEEVQDQLIADLREEKTQKAVATIFETLKENARIDNFLTNETTGGKKTAAPAAPSSGIRQTGAQAADPASGVKSISTRPKATATR